MKLSYYPATDSLYIDFVDRPATDSRKILEDVVVDIDDGGSVVGIDIDHASNLDLATLELMGLPLR